MAATTLACPTCGDPNQPVPATRITRCTACTAALYVEDPPQPHLMVKPIKTAEAALAATKSWMHGMRHRELLAWRARLSPPRLVYVPFSQVDATVLGQIYGKRRHETEKSHYYTNEEVDVAKEQSTSEPLADVGETGVMRLPAGVRDMTVPFDEAAIAAAGGEIVPALVTESSASDRARDAFLASAHVDENLETITGTALTIVGAKDTTIHFPYWRVDYTAGTFGYVAMVDAQSGEIAYGRAPGSPLFHSAFYALALPLCALVMLVATVIMLAIFAVAAEVADGSSKVAAGVFLVGAVIGAGGCWLGGKLALIVHRGLEFAGEVESGYAAHAGSELLDTDDSFSVRRAREQAEVEADAELIELEAQA